MSQHRLSTLSADQLKDLLIYYREQEVAKHLTINASEFQGGQLLVVNYTDSYNETTPPADWDWRMELARGCVFFVNGPVEAELALIEVVVHAMPKFHSYGHCPDAVAHIESDEQLAIMRKHDGSYVSIASFRGEVLLFTRGSRHNLQTNLARCLISEFAMTTLAGLNRWTIGTELIHASDAKIEKSRGPDRLVLLYAVGSDGCEVLLEDLAKLAGTLGEGFEAVGSEVVTGSVLLNRLDHLNNVSSLDEMHEGFVVEMLGRKFKAKPQIYKKLAGRGAPAQPTQSWMAKCFNQMKTLEEVRLKVSKMKDAPLDYGDLATQLFDEHMACVEQRLASLRALQSSFEGPKELAQNTTVSKDTKNLLFPCLRLPSEQREAWFESEGAVCLVAKNIAKNCCSEDVPKERGFKVGRGRLVLTGAPSKNDLDSWVSGLNCVITLLRSTELQDRKLEFAKDLPRLGIEWIHIPITGAALEDENDRDSVMQAAEMLHKRLQGGEGVVVHCSAGLHRTGIVAYLALRLGDRSSAASLELLGQVRWDTRAELERLHFKGQSASGVTLDLISVAEGLLQSRQIEGNQSELQTD